MGELCFAAGMIVVALVGLFPRSKPSDRPALRPSSFRSQPFEA